jgi:hypothetical protein
VCSRYVAPYRSYRITEQQAAIGHGVGCLRRQPNNFDGASSGSFFGKGVEDPETLRITFLPLIDLSVDDIFMGYSIAPISSSDLINNVDNGEHSQTVSLMSTICGEGWYKALMGTTMHAVLMCVS